MARTKRDPRTKEQLLDRMLSFDFDGDIRHLGEEAATIQRVSPNTLRLKFPSSGSVFDLTVHRPREFAQAKPETRSFKRDDGESRIEPVTQETEGATKAPRRKRADAGKPRTRQERRANA